LTGKRHWTQLFNHTWKEKRANNRVKKLKYKLYELGFTETVLAELKHVVQHSDDRYLVRAAAWEIALWYANEQTKQGAESALHYLPLAIKGQKQKEQRRRISIVEAECYHLLEETTKAKQSIHKALAVEEHIDLFLAMANLEMSLSEKIGWINKAMDMFGLSRITLNDENYPFPYDRLSTLTDGEKHAAESKSSKVTVIMPVYNGEPYLRTSIESILSQTWENLELIIVDDCSTDASTSIIQEYIEADKRVQLIKTDKNGGAYIARNHALKLASGEYITINDVDDWSHPQKIEKQVRHLIEHKETVANTSQQARATEELTFFRRGKPGSYLFANLSSLMFRREPVMEKLGFWDEVRFGADGEFKRRLKRVFGENSITDLMTGPLSFQRQSTQSLTGNKAFGYHGYFMGVRKEYLEAYQAYHRKTDNLFYQFRPGKRPFAVPEPMLPARENKLNVRKHFDVIIVSEFRLQGGTNMSNIEEIKAQKSAGLKTGLIQMSRYDFDSQKEINYKVRELIDGEQVQMLVYGEKVTCDVLIVRHPPVLQEWQRYVPKVEAKTVKVIINQPPKREYSKKGTTLYDMRKCVTHLQAYFGKKGKWYPIGPQVRETLWKHHSKELKAIKLSSEDWVNIINVEEWRRNHRPVKHSVIKIGRHSRSQYVKWPNNPKELLDIYPESEKYEVHVLGGAEAPKKVLGRIPSNWTVHEFGEIPPNEFLKELDVFVYYTHPDWVEAFGRVIFEAMAAGVPVIIQPKYKPLFEEAAIYAEPREVQQKITALMEDEDFYNKQVEVALNYVDNRFGYAQHISRLNSHIHSE
jgi:glycosyltransferase involved in cell wall biosynthesis